MSEKTNLPATTYDGDGFYDTGDDGRLLKGYKKKCDVTQQIPWQKHDGTADTALYLVAATLEAVQRWQNQRPIETIIETPNRLLPDDDELREWNARIPREQWERGPDGNLRAPWQRAHIAYLFDPEICQQCTYIGGSIGAGIAVSEVRKATVLRRKLRGTKAIPLVKLNTQPFKTRYGMKARPWLEIVGWANDGEPTLRIEKAEPTKKSAKKLARRQEPDDVDLDDELPF
jgi:hypothetical protein